MKTLTLTMTLAITLFSSLGFANSVTAICEGMTNGDRTITLYINDGKLNRMMVQTQGSLPKMYATQEVNSDTRSTIYKAVGAQGVVEVQNSVLNGDRGTMSFAGERFDCE